jgi:iron complex transport system ATP-binding protein
MSAPVLQMLETQVDAGRRRILDVDALRVWPAEVVAIVGPNGAGKSTLLQVALGFRRPARGTITLLDEDVPHLSRAGLARLRCRVAYIPQELAAHGHMPLTLREVVAIGRTGLAGLGRPLSDADWQHVDHAIDRLGLTPQRDQMYATLSGGEQRKTLLARGLAQQPALLILDEPTAHLDLGWRERLVTTLDELHRELQLPMLIVCHELEVIPPCCRRVVLLDQGRIADDGSPDTVFTADRMRRLYGVPLAVEHRTGRHLVVPTPSQADT